MTAPVPHGRRESIAAALYSLVNAAASKVLSLKTSSRKIRSFDQVDGSQMPALFQTQLPETQERDTIGQPAKRTLHFEFWIYTSDAQADGVIPSQQLNNLVDAIEAALAPSPLTGAQTLGGLVLSTRIEGGIEYYENATSDGKSIAAIPVAVLMP